MAKAEIGIISREREVHAKDASWQHAGERGLAVPGAGLSLDRFNPAELAHYDHAQAQRLRFMDGVFSLAPRDIESSRRIIASVPADKIVCSQDEVRADIILNRLRDSSALTGVTIAPMHFIGPNGAEEVFLVCDGHHSLVSRILKGEFARAASHVSVQSQCLHELADFAGIEAVKDLLDGLAGRTGALPRIVDKFSI